MNVAQITMNELKDIDLPNAKLAYTIINSLLSQNAALGDLLALLAHSLDEDVVKAVTNTNEWQTYLDSKREMENTKLQIDKLTEYLNALENK